MTGTEVQRYILNSQVVVGGRGLIYIKNNSNQNLLVCVEP